MSVASSPALKESKLLWERSSLCQKAREMDRYCAAAADWFRLASCIIQSWHCSRGEEGREGEQSKSQVERVAGKLD